MPKCPLYQGASEYFDYDKKATCQYDKGICYCSISELGEFLGKCRLSLDIYEQGKVATLLREAREIVLKARDKKIQSENKEILISTTH